VDGRSGQNSGKTLTSSESINMLRELLASRAPAVISLVLSTVLAAGVIPGCATPIADLPQAPTEQAAAPFGSLPGETPTGPLCTVKDKRSASQFPRLAYSPGFARAEGDERPVTKPLSRFAKRIARPAAEAEDIERLAAEDTQPTAPERSPAVVLFDPFNAAATAAVGTHRAADAESIDDYLFAAYRRLPLKHDASGDFTWKDVAAAARMGLSLEDYVIGGMDPDFKELIYAAGKQMDAAGIQWSMLSAFRDDWRQQIAAGFKASAGNSCHGGSRAVGGYGNGRCVDLWTAAGPVEELFAWIDRVGAAMALARPMPSRDPAHVQPVGDWRRIAKQMRVARLKTLMIATARGLGGADAAAGLTQLATSIGLAATTPSIEGQPLPSYAAIRPRLILAPAQSPAAVGAHAALGVHKVRRKLASAATATRQHVRTRLSAVIRNSRRI
jgi:hypothetical protein